MKEVELGVWNIEVRVFLVGVALVRGEGEEEDEEAEVSTRGLLVLGFALVGL